MAADGPTIRASLLASPPCPVAIGRRGSHSFGKNSYWSKA